MIAAIVALFSLIPWWVASLVANVCIVRIEFINRTVDGNFLDVLPQTWWMIAIAQWGLFNSWNGAHSMMIAWAGFTAMNNVMRLASVQWAVGEPPSLLTAVGSAGMFLCAYLIKMGSTASS